jgi:hypothetical protein
MMRIIALFSNVGFNEEKKELGGITDHAARVKGACAEGIPMSSGDRTVACLQGHSAGYPAACPGKRKKFQCLA